MRRFSLIIVALLLCSLTLSAQSSPSFVYAQGTGTQGGPFTVTTGAIVQPSTFSTGGGNAWASDNSVFGCSISIWANNVFITTGYTSVFTVIPRVLALPTTLAGVLWIPGNYWLGSLLQCLNLKMIAQTATANWYLDALRR